MINKHRNPDFIYVNCRFCGVIHSADRHIIYQAAFHKSFIAWIKRKNVQTKYYFLRELWRWDSNNHGKLMLRFIMLIGHV